MEIPARRGVVTEAAMSPGSAADESHVVQVNVRTRKSCLKKRPFLRSSRRTTLYQVLVPSQVWSWRWREPCLRVAFRRDGSFRPPVRLVRFVNVPEDA